MKRVIVPITAAVLAVGSLVAQSPLKFVDRPFPADELVAPGDYDGDGDLDGLAWTNGVFDGRILVNDGHARFTAAPATGLAIPAAARPWHALAADFNGDGFCDVFVHQQAAAAPGNLIWFGAPGFVFGPAATPATSVGLVPLAFPQIHSATTLDFDQDGDLDLALALTPASIPITGSRHELWANNGAGGFVAVAAGLPAVPPVGVSRVVAGDLDADGAVDLVFLGSGFASTTVAAAAYRNVGGSFAPYAAYPASLSAPLAAVGSVVHGDFNGDGLLDVACVLPPSLYFGVQSIEVRLGGAASFAPPVVTVLPGGVLPPGGQPFAAVDVDGDAFAELVFAGNADGATGLSVFDVLPTGALGAQLFALSGPFRVGPLVDLDQDGDVDGATGLAVATTTPVSPFLPPVLLPSANAPGSPGLLLGDGAGGFASLRSAGDPRGDFASSSQSSTLVVADFDGDGSPDVAGVAGAATGAGAYVAALGDGVGGFVISAAYQSSAPFVSPVLLPPNPTGARVAADFDLDGDVDLFVRGIIAGINGGPLVDYVFSNTGSGFAPGTASPVAGAVVCSACFDAVAAACDIDRNGYPDVMVSALNPIGLSTTTVSLNTGGTLGAASPLGATHATRDLLRGDFDGDGFDDVLQLGSSTPNAVGSVLWRAQAGGPAAIPLPGLSGEYGAVGDLDGDGDADAVADGTVYFFTGGAPAAGPTLASALRAPGTLVDLDGDGDLDLVEAPSTVMMNLGGAVFGPPETATWRFAAITATNFNYWVTTTDYRCFPADVDRDGDMDLIAPGPTVITNVTRHLAPDGAPRIGRPTGVKLYGAPGQGYALFASPNAVQLPFAPFGTLLIDPATAVPIAAGSFAPPGGPGAGEALVPLFVPNSPAYVGLTLHWQSLDFGSLHLTNRLTSVVLPD